jgi:hypothetical protein
MYTFASEILLLLGCHNLAAIKSKAPVLLAKAQYIQI